MIKFVNNNNHNRAVQAYSLSILRDIGFNASVMAG